MHKSKKILAVASGGGHLIQLLRLRPALEGHRQYFMTTTNGYQDTYSDSKWFIVRDASRWDKFGLLIMLFQILMIFIQIRPDVVITTGAAPGVFAVRVGKLFGAKTLWLDSIANAEEVSMSGQLAGPHADLWLTQWPELEKDEGPLFRGRVL